MDDTTQSSGMPPPLRPTSQAKSEVIFSLLQRALAAGDHTQYEKILAIARNDLDLPKDFKVDLQHRVEELRTDSDRQVLHPNATPQQAPPNLIPPPRPLEPSYQPPAPRTILPFQGLPFDFRGSYSSPAAFRDALLWEYQRSINEEMEARGFIGIDAGAVRTSSCSDHVAGVKRKAETSGSGGARRPARQ